jgi:hypothetical protein
VKPVLPVVPVLPPDPELPEFPDLLVVGPASPGPPPEVALQFTLGALGVPGAVVAVVHDPGAGGRGTPELDPA